MSDSQPSAPTRSLPEKANLEQLKKQAKELLAAYRAGELPAITEVQLYEQSPDPAQFALHDAQRVLARAYGFEGWPKLKEHVNRATVTRLAEAVRRGDVQQTRSMLRQRPELVNVELAENDERRPLHHAVLAHNVEMVRLLMREGADARKGVYPHRDATVAYTIAQERSYHDIVAVIEQEEQYRREAMSCPNVSVRPVQEEINQAIRTGDNATAIRLLEADESLLRACDLDGRTPLHIAAQVANQEMVAWMLPRRVNVRKEDNKSLTPLDRAALGVDPRNDRAVRFPAIAKLLLARGAQMNLRAAVALGEAAPVREIVASDPGALRRTDDWIRGGPLTLAVRHGQIAMVRLLLDLGADVDERTTMDLEETVPTWGEPLWYAACAGRYDIAKLLLDRGADPNANVYASGWPLHHAYERKDERLKHLLISRGARPQPWTLAGAHDVNTSRQMLEADTSEALAKEFAWSAAHHGCPAILELALPRLAWSATDRRWHWILIQPSRGCLGDQRADHEGFFECMKMLLARGVDPNVSSRFGQKTLHFAAAYSPMGGGSVRDEPERARFAEMLLDAGARLDVRDEMLKSTPLGWAARWGRREMVELLLARGAPVNEPDAEPWATPLAWAIKRGHTQIATLLL